MSKGNPESNWPQAKISKVPDIGANIGRLNEVMNLTPCKKNDPQGVAERINQMFEFCKEENRRPTVELLSAFIGVNRTTLWKWIEDENSEAGKLVERAKEIINVLLTEMALSKKAPYEMIIWLQKNHYLYRDISEHHFVQDKEPLPTRENIIQALPDIIPGEHDFDDEVFGDDE